MSEHQYIDTLITSFTSNNYATIVKDYDTSLLNGPPSQYYLAIDRYYIDVRSIPLFEFNSTANYYTVELMYNGVFSGRFPVVYQTTSPTLTPSNQKYWWVYSVDIFVAMVNAALATAFIALGGAVILPLGSTAPFFTYDSVTHLLALNADGNYLSSLVNPITIYMNNNLWEYFDGIPIMAIGNLFGPSVANSRDVSFMIINKGNNTFTSGGTTYYIMNTDNGADCVVRWNICKGLYLTTQIGVRPEVMPNQVSPASPFSKNTNVSSKNVLSNFDIVYGESVKPLIIQYILNSPYKYIDIINDRPLNQISVSVYWYDKYNNSYPLILYNSDIVSIRFLFVKK